MEACHPARSYSGSITGNGGLSPGPWLFHRRQNRGGQGGLGPHKVASGGPGPPIICVTSKKIMPHLPIYDEPDDIHYKFLIVGPPGSAAYVLGDFLLWA